MGWLVFSSFSWFVSFTYNYLVCCGLGFLVEFLVENSWLWAELGCCYGGRLSYTDIILWVEVSVTLYDYTPGECRIYHHIGKHDHYYTLHSPLKSQLQNKCHTIILSTNHTQLMLAAYHGHAPLVKLLLSYGASPNQLNDRGQSPLAGAVFKKEDAVIEVYTLLFLAISLFNHKTNV